MFLVFTGFLGSDMSNHSGVGSVTIAAGSRLRASYSHFFQRTTQNGWTASILSCSRYNRSGHARAGSSVSTWLSGGGCRPNGSLKRLRATETVGTVGEVRTPRSYKCWCVNLLFASTPNDVAARRPRASVLMQNLSPESNLENHTWAVVNVTQFCPSR